MYRPHVFLLMLFLMFYIGTGIVNAQNKGKIFSYTYATLMDTHSDAGSNSDDLKFEYMVKGRPFHTMAGANIVTLAKGDKFRVKYDSLNPVDAKILFEEPIFLPTDKTDDVEGTLKEVHKHYCIYKYHANMDYTKIQYYYEGTVEKYNLKKGDKFEVRFILGYPTRAIIYFDKPY